MSPTPDAAPAPTVADPRQAFLDAFGQEHAVTLRVLRAYPADQLELRPHPRARSARELAWVFVQGQGLAERALTTGLDWSKPPSGAPAVPETMDEIIATLDAGHQRIVELMRGMRPEELRGTVTFPIAPKTMGDWPKMRFLWFLLHDQIHHRGQLSVYLRMAGGTVPSIYGPTADEEWL